MKRGKELNVKISNNFNTKLGTIDNKNPKSFYISISGWGDVITKSEVNYNKVINELYKSIKKYLYDNLDPTFYNRNNFIVDFDMRESGIKFNKKSYMNCEITVFQTNEINNLYNIINNITPLISDLLLNILNKNKYFNFNKTKSN